MEVMDLTAWEKKRRNTLYTYLFYGFISAMDNTCVAVTFFPYFDSLIRVDNAKFYFSISVVLFSISSAIIAVLVGRLVDRTRSVKYSIYFFNCCGILGELLYTLHYSPYIPVVARAICGVLSAKDSVLKAEIIRCYTEEEASQSLWRFQAASVIGAITGSWISLTFVSINFHVGSLHIDKTNFVGLFLSAVLIIHTILVYFFAHDCSKEYDFKSVADAKKLQNSDKNVIGAYGNKLYDEENADISIRSKDGTEIPKAENKDSNENIASQEPNIVDNEAKVTNNPEASIPITTSTRRLVPVLKGFIRNPNIMLIIIASFVFAGTGFTVDIMKPVIILKIFKWSDKSLNIFSAVKCIGELFGLLLLSKFCVESKRIFWVSIFCIISACLILVTLTIIIVVDLTFNYQIVMIVLFGIPYVAIWYLDITLFPNMLGRMVHGNIQSFSESLRSTVSLISCIVSGLVIAMGNSVTYWVPGLNGCAVILLIIFVLRNKHLIDIKRIELH